MTGIESGMPERRIFLKTPEFKILRGKEWITVDMFSLQPGYGMTRHLFDNIVWHTLIGPHARHTVGTNDARRYVRGFPPFIGFADIAQPNLHGLAPFVEPGEHVYCDGWAGETPAGWRIESENILVRMRWAGAMPLADPAPDAKVLDLPHASAVFELAALTGSGPFGLRAIELGEYVGVFDGVRLVAMAGERRCAGGYGEISGVCTHPDYRGRGFAERLVLKLIRRQMLRGDTPFLRVMHDNLAACRLYRRLGFQECRRSVARTISLR